MLRERGHVLGQVAAGQNAAVNLRMQRLHAPVEHFREAGVVGHFGHLEAGVSQQLGGAASGEERHALRSERLGEVDDAGLVGDGNESLLDHDGQ